MVPREQKGRHRLDAATLAAVAVSCETDTTTVLPAARVYAHSMSGDYSDDGWLASHSFMSMSDSDESDEDTGPTVTGLSGCAPPRPLRTSVPAPAASARDKVCEKLRIGRESEAETSDEPRRPSIDVCIGAFLNADWRDLPKSCNLPTCVQTKHCEHDDKSSSSESNRRSSTVASTSATFPDLLTKAGTAFDWSAYALAFDEVEEATFQHLEGEAYLCKVTSKSAISKRKTVDHLVLHASQKLLMEFDLEQREQLQSHIQASIRKTGRRPRASSICSPSVNA
jgi:hypothetical protein